MITVENLIFEYPGKRALKDVSFTIEEGSITALVGPNGAGKTTLMRCIAALDEPFSGRITVNGIDSVEDPRKVHSEVGYLSDFFGVYDDLTVRQCLSFIASIHQIEDAQIAQRVEATAGKLNLKEYLDVKAGELSRGLRQRLGIAQAIIHEPKILLLDEPASGLDPEARMSLSSLFLSLRDQGMTLLVSSHILAELEDYCTDMLLLRDGAIIDHCKADAKDSQVTVIKIQVSGDISQYSNAFNKLEGISNLRLEGDAAEFTISSANAGVDSVLKKLVENGVPVRSFTENKRRLQDIYMSYASGGN